MSYTHHTQGVFFFKYKDAETYKDRDKNIEMVDKKNLFTIFINVKIK